MCFFFPRFLCFLCLRPFATIRQLVGFSIEFFLFIFLFQVFRKVMRDTSTLVRANTATDVKVDICLMPLALSSRPEKLFDLRSRWFLVEWSLISGLCSCHHSSTPPLHSENKEVLSLKQFKPKITKYAFIVFRASIQEDFRGLEIHCTSKIP